MIATWHLGKTFWPPPRWLTLSRHALSHPVRALSDVTLNVNAGEVFGLVGPNGAGKTTLLKVLATLVLPSEGRAVVYGADVVREGHEVRRVMGLTSGDERSFYWRLTGQENLEFFAGLRGLSPDVARRRIDSVVDLVGLRSAVREVVARYSTGMRQRLATARALLGDPPVLMLDEPTRSLDPDATDQFRALIRALAGDGRTILVATHNLAEAVAICDRVAFIGDGIVRRVVSVPEDERELREIYGKTLHDR